MLKYNLSNLQQKQPTSSSTANPANRGPAQWTSQCAVHPPNHCRLVRTPPLTHTAGVRTGTKAPPSCGTLTQLIPLHSTGKEVWYFVLAQECPPNRPDLCSEWKALSHGTVHGVGLWHRAVQECHSGGSGARWLL
ncbi:hypothetical protein E2C01_027914 [Portunus trituberculatus]|uniref:Uncharacterized protein n=1 Tax=Portunus trituberculatus TaxID=210409 RepID=A0A5B7EJC1_PORTR|nr:hypothetical protein [Portunus trituberculatus]